MIENFKIEVVILGKTGGVSKNVIHYDVSKFNGGEINIKLNDNFYTKKVDKISITGNIKSSDNLMELLLLEDAISNMFEYNKKLLCLPYVAYSRQDRVCNTGEALSIRVFSKLINSMNFDKVYTMDNHSDVSTALLNNCVNQEIHELLSDRLISQFDYIISPDAGANKKMHAVCKKFNKKMIRADKTRDVSTGNITGTEVYADKDVLKGKNVIIIDDICDGGRTFLELAKVLKAKGCLSISLYITHGIFANGLASMQEAGIDWFYTKNNIFDLADKNLMTL